MNKRPPFLGYNHNVRHKGRLFHVQTEDSGLSRPVLTTHVFVEGIILATLRGQYTADEPDTVVQKRMQEQHKTMLKRVRDGEFDQASETVASSAAAAEPAAPQGRGKPAEAVPESISAEPAPPALRMASSQAAPGALAAGPATSRKPGPPPTRRDAPSASGTPIVHGPSLNERQTVEVARKHTGDTTQELAPVPKTADSSALAARLGISSAVPQGMVPPPPIANIKPIVLPQEAPQAIQGSSHTRSRFEEAERTLSDEDGRASLAMDDDEVEMLVAPPSEDDEPQLTIEVAEPADEELEAADLSKATPLPVAVPMGHDETFMMGVEAMVPPPRVGPFTVSVPFGEAARPVRGTRPLSNRPLHSGTLRARPTSEGVVVLCLGPAATAATTAASGRRPPLSGGRDVRITQPNLRPTRPSSVPLPPPGITPPPGDVPRALDDKLMAFLRREAAR